MFSSIPHPILNLAHRHPRNGDKPQSDVHAAPFLRVLILKVYARLLMNLLHDIFGLTFLLRVCFYIGKLTSAAEEENKLNLYTAILTWIGLPPCRSRVSQELTHEERP